MIHRKLHPHPTRSPSSGRTHRPRRVGEGFRLHPSRAALVELHRAAIDRLSHPALAEHPLTPGEAFAVRQDSYTLNAAAERMGRQ